MTKKAHGFLLVDRGRIRKYHEISSCAFLNEWPLSFAESFAESLTPSRGTAHCRSVPPPPIETAIHCAFTNGFVHTHLWIKFSFPAMVLRNSTSPQRLCRISHSSNDSAFIFNAPNSASALVRGLDSLIINLARLTKEPSEDSPYLKDHLAPQSAEVKLSDARVSGRLPPTLKGLFCSVIPSGHSTLPVGGYHVFEGDGSVASVRIRHNGRASFAYQHLQTEKLKVEKELGYSPVVSVMAMKGFSGLALILLSQLRDALGPKYSSTTANTNIVTLGRRVFALMEQERPFELRLSPDGYSFDAVAPLEFDSYKGPFTAHPKKHPSNGLTYALNYTPKSIVHDAAIVVLNNNTELVRKIPLRLGRKPMIHDAAITEKYLVILDLPLLISPEEILKKDGALVKVHLDKPARIGLFPVDAVSQDEITWFDVPPCFVFHSLNAYDTEDGRVVLHLCQMSDFKLSYDWICSDQKLVRYELNVKTGKASWDVEPMDLASSFDGVARADMPQVHPSRVGKKAKYGFGVVVENKKDGGFEKLTGLWKYSLETSETSLVKFKDSEYAVAEPRFIPKNNGVDDEDECFVTVFVRDSNNITLNVYDAATMDNEPLAKVHAPSGFHLPTGFHSTFFTEDEIAKFATSKTGAVQKLAPSKKSSQ